MEEFGLESDEDIEALRRRLRAMERDGQLIYTRRGTYAPVDKLDWSAGASAAIVTVLASSSPMMAATTCSSARRRCGVRW